MKYIIKDVDELLEMGGPGVGFIHGCNCEGVMGAGVAKLVADYFPACVKHYRRHLGLDGGVLHDYELYGSGEVIPWIAPNQMLILNALTQVKPGRNAKYDLIDSCFRTIGSHYTDKIQLYYPLIGCGIGGLRWDVVKEIIDYGLRDNDHYCIVREIDVRKYNLKVETNGAATNQLKFQYPAT